MMWAVRVVCVREMKNGYKMFVAKSQRKRLLGRPRHCRQENISVDVREVRCKGVNWI
jgi:hypothetical protein